ncbi:hypothetical protein HK105_200155 [Polyrhizophydium stewartii]|uniref:IFT81 calponin homology domain-containing protein n=1 Tax=Polyrhizophydium stewartii TaxID=2732419 RepID=A0ABR4NKY3_9FUNG
MTTPSELKLIAERLSAPPFSKTWSVIQLHDEVAPVQLLQCVSDIVAHLDQANPQSPHRSVDLRGEMPEDTAGRLAEFLRMLKFKDAVSDFNAFRIALFDMDRTTVLSTLHFLLKDLAFHKKRAYLALFLSMPDVPAEFCQDDVIVDLSRQIEAQQEEFKSTHKWLEGLKQSGNNAAALKREIQQMEEEKQQVINKVTRLRKKVEGVANRDQWLEAAKNLRTEQQNEAMLAERIREQRSQVAQSDKKLNTSLQALKEAKASLAASSPDAFFAKMQEENRMNKFLAETNLPKVLEETRQKIRDLSSILAEPAMGEADLAAIEKEITEMNHVIAQLAERKMAKSNSTGDANLALFRQQAAIIARKKEGAVQKLASQTEELAQLTAEWERKQELIRQSAGSKMLKGDEFKRYVSELRGKSTNFKRKKAELSELMAEFGILQRTEEILRAKETTLKDMIHAVEKKSGVVGFHAAQEALEKVSEKKSEVDEAKGRTLNEISGIIQTLMATINASGCPHCHEKKNLLAPIIQELRQLRQQAQELETEYLEKKRLYDATIIGLESETAELEMEIKSNRQDIVNDQSRYHYLHSMLRLAEISQDRVMVEMKSYIGGDEMIELQQKARGFKTYRELYNKRISEHEHQAKSLKEHQKDVKAKQETNMKQIAMFKDVLKLLDLKAEHNQRVLSGGASGGGVSGSGAGGGMGGGMGGGDGGGGVVTMDRLVL